MTNIFVLPYQGLVEDYRGWMKGLRGNSLPYAVLDSIDALVKRIRQHEYPDFMIIDQQHLENDAAIRQLVRQFPDLKAVPVVAISLDESFASTHLKIVHVLNPADQNSASLARMIAGYTFSTEMLDLDPGFFQNGLDYYDMTHAREQRKNPPAPPCPKGPVQ